MRPRSMLALALLLLSSCRPSIWVSGSLEFSPSPQESLAANGLILATGANEQRGAVHGPLKATKRQQFADLVWDIAAHEPFLQGEGGPVKLRVVERTRAGRHAVALLQPEKPLDVGKRYKLAMKDYSSEDLEKLDLIISRGVTDVSWRICEPDTAPPSWSGPPELGNERGYPILEKNHESTWVSMHVPVVDDAPDLRFRVSVTDLEGTGATVEFLEEGNCCTGCCVPHYGIMAGPGERLELQTGHRYRLSLIAVDVAGREVPAPGPPIEFVAP